MLHLLSLGYSVHLSLGQLHLLQCLEQCLGCGWHSKKNSFWINEVLKDVYLWESEKTRNSTWAFCRAFGLRNNPLYIKFGREFSLLFFFFEWYCDVISPMTIHRVGVSMVTVLFLVRILLRRNLNLVSHKSRFPWRTIKIEMDFHKSASCVLHQIIGKVEWKTYLEAYSESEKQHCGK